MLQCTVVRLCLVLRKSCDTALLSLCLLSAEIFPLLLGEPSASNEACAYELTPFGPRHVPRNDFTSLWPWNGVFLGNASFLTLFNVNAGNVSCFIPACVCRRRLTHQRQLHQCLRCIRHDSCPDHRTSSDQVRLDVRNCYACYPALWPNGTCRRYRAMPGSPTSTRRSQMPDRRPRRQQRGESSSRTTLLTNEVYARTCTPEYTKCGVHEMYE